MNTPPAPGPPDRPDRPARWLAAVLLLETANASYLAAFDSATIFYHLQVVLHVTLGALLILLVLPRLGSLAATPRGAAARAGRVGTAAVAALALAAAASIVTAVVLTVTGTATPWRRLLETHVAASVVALGAGVVWAAAAGRRAAARRAGLLLGLALLLPLGVRARGLLAPPRSTAIENPAAPPLTPFQEGAGERGAFFPSSVRTVGDRLIPHDFFLESKACGNRGCHPDITAQWTSSMHHFSSFNNQWYRKSIEYMQEVVGTKPSKWCGGCHDQAVLLTGRMDTPIVRQIATPQAQAGIGCLVCHSIVHVSDTMGQGGYVLEYPEMHRLVASRNPVVHALHDYMVRLDPGPHKATMLKPFHRQARAEFCSACHKVHLDVPVNRYRWFRGFDEYDAWQGSGVSGQGARAFYYPAKPKDCADCHMPLVRSADQGNVGGFVHSHRFPAANTAVPFANRDAEQLRTTQDFLRAGILSVDIFAATEETGPGPVAAGAPVPSAGEPRAAALFPDLPDVVPGGGAAAVGAGAGAAPAGAAGGAPRGRAGPALVAQLDRAAPFLLPGRTYRFDVVARTRTIGHFFPGGTVDAFDVWLELKVEDAGGRVVYWSGYVEDDGHGPVEAGAHRYRALLIDAHGNEINKRNAWAARAAVYARLIPPGAADVGRFRVAIPKDVRGPLALTARMNYRKFSWWNTHFSYAGVRRAAARGAGPAPDYDDGPFDFDGDTSQVSGEIKTVPDLPVTVIAEERLSLPLAAAGAARNAPARPQPFDRERWNDYGIGMLLQGDLSAARAAFETVTTVAPDFADGFVNVGRVLVQEGDDEHALPVLERALAIDPDKASAHYFLALALKTRGRYDEALRHLRAAAERFPRDKVVRDQIGRLLFLQRKPGEAVAELRKTIAVDPEDLTAHYNLMLCYRALGDGAGEKREQTLYARFKADEASQALTGAYRRLNPEDNLERQPIHEHVNRYVARRASPGTPAPRAAAGRSGR